MQPYIVDFLSGVMRANGMGEGNATHDELMLNTTIKPMIHHFVKWGANRGVTDLLVATSSSFTTGMIILVFLLCCHDQIIYNTTIKHSYDFLYRIRRSVQ